MAWITPKTNWVATDYFNYQDYERIRGNLLEIKSLADLLYLNVPDVQTMDSKTDYSALLYASDINKFEQNLTMLNENTIDIEIGEEMEYFPNGTTIDYAELNRIESGIKQIYETLSVEYASLIKLAFTLGGAKFKV